MSALANKHDVFQAIADPNRRKLILLLSQAECLSIVSLASHFDLSRTGVTKHLQVLDDAGLVAKQKVGRETLYELRPEPLREVRQWIAYFEQFWDNKLATLRHYVEQGGE